MSMRQIAQEVGVQFGALCVYTPNKRTLLFDLMLGHMHGLLAALAVLDMTGDPEKDLERFTRFHIRYHLPRADLVFVSYMELRNLTPENFVRIEEARHRYEDALEGILRVGAETGVFAVRDSRVTTRALIALLTCIGRCKVVPQ